MGLHLRTWILGTLAFLVFRALRLTWKIELIEPQELQLARRNKKGFILAHWHGDELAIVHLARRYRIVTMVSTSKDGQLMAFVFRLLGGKVARGSSTRRSLSGMRELFRILNTGHSTSFAVDGPKGPIFVIKPGVFEVSRLFQIPIFGCSVEVDRCWKFPRSWNKTYLPKPFAKIRIVWRGPIPPVAKEADPRSSELQAALKNILSPTCE